MLTILSVAVTLIASALYVRSALSGDARPQASSWSAWGALLIVGSAAALSAGQVPAGTYGLACAAACVTVAVLAVRGGWQVTRSDAACLAAAAAGLVLLAIVHSPGWAVALAAGADLAAYVPTIAHAWRDPSGEPWSAYGLYAAGAALALAAVPSWSFTAVAYPAYLLAADAAVTVMIIARSRPRPA